MSNERKSNSDLRKKAEKIRQKMKEDGEIYHDSDELEDNEGPILGPRDDFEYRRLLNGISDNHDEKSNK